MVEPPAAPEHGRVFRRLSLSVLGFDLLAVVPVSFAWLRVFEIRDLSTTVLLCALFFAIRVAIWQVYLWIQLRDLEAWLRRPESLELDELRALDRSVHAVPLRFCVVYSLAWALYFGGVPLLAYLALPEVLAVGAADFVTVGFQLGAVATAAPSLVYVLALVMLEPGFLVLARALELRAPGSPLQSKGTTLSQRLVGLGLGLALGPMFWVAGIAWDVGVESSRELAARDLRDRVAIAAREGEPAAGMVVVEAGQLPAGLEPGEAVGARADLDLRDERVRAVAPLESGRWLLAEAPLISEPRDFWLRFLPFLLAAALWCVLTVLAFAQSFVVPIRRLRDTIRRVVEVGDLREMGRIPAPHSDELGELTGDVNELLGTLGRLADRAQEVAEGKLDLEIRGVGDLPEAFRRMVGRLQEIVGEIRETAVELAAAAAEIHAATVEQQTAAEQHGESVSELSRAMESLAVSSIQASKAAHGVLDNAESTLTTTDEMGRKIAELSELSRSIRELLEVIREVADRSDLLALNGSLEATRAGEAGRGFALVATEMRRLAERVTGSVSDVRELVSSIESSSTDTVMATERSRRLAESTAEAAREIAELTRRQSQDTAQASQGVGEVANVIAQIGDATAQTRGATEDLQIQARALEALVRSFELRSGAQVVGDSRER